VKIRESLLSEVINAHFPIEMLLLTPSALSILVANGTYPNFASLAVQGALH
jgi:hypothetical protein